MMLFGSIYLWLFCTLCMLKAFRALAAEKPAMMIAMTGEAVFVGYLAAALWGLS